MSTARSAAEPLPTELHSALQRAYQDYAEAATSRYSSGRTEAGARLADLAAYARESGWPFAVLARSCGVSGERLRQITQQYGTGEPPSPAVPVPRYVRPGRSPRPAPKSRPHLTEEEARELRELAPLAAENTGSHAPDSPARLASDELTTLIRSHHERGVIWQELSDATRPWTRWPIPAEDLEKLRTAEAEGGVSASPPALRVSGLRQRAARAAR